MDLSSSSSSSSPRWRYDVFPSFRGPDVRQRFLSHLIKEFERKGIKTFRDNEIERGESISPELKRAIRESRICIIILSKNYTSSSWTLTELVEIMECRETCGKMVMTIFYEVDPSDVRKQSGDFGMAYIKTCETQTEDQKLRWKEALTNVASILGEHSHNWNSEADMISKIATDVSNQLNLTASRDFDDLVGIEAHVAEMNSLLCLESDETRMVGIWGPLGIGKTTIARTTYNRISRSFQRSLFMENVKRSYRSGEFDSDTSKRRLHRKFLSKILDHKDMKITHLRTAEERLKSEKVLVVLDNVDKIEQLEALANGPHWFGKGSRIIVTTEDKSLFEAHKIQHIYEVKFPSKDEALKIFSLSAFTQDAPPDGYRELAVEVTELTSYLPLGLSVLGKALRGKSVNKWKDELVPRIKNSLSGDIEQVLIVGYNGLDDQDKDIFLHIACLFQGKTIDCVMRLLAKSGPDIKYGLRVLVERALISKQSDRIVIMHRLLRQMGREIVRKHSIHLSMRCRILIGAHNIYGALADNIGTGTFFHRSLMDKGRKLEKLWDGIKVLVFLRIPLYVFSMFWLLKFGFLSIMSMFPSAFANIRFGISRRVFAV